MSYAHDSSDAKTIIHITDTGFNPKYIEIKTGETVRFENIDSQEHWPASNNHPNHTLYDETTLEDHCSDNKNTSFDACRPLKTNEVWEFAFIKEGSFEYHDHLWPHMVGTITVVNEVDEARNINSVTNLVSSILDFFNRLYLKIFKFMGLEDNSLHTHHDGGEEFQNLLKNYKQIVVDQNPKQALIKVQQDSSNSEFVMEFCHEFTHEIGRISFDKYGSFSEAASYQVDFCNSGYIHGVFESYFTHSDDSIIDLSQTCQSYAEGKRWFDLWHCYHGVGHGLMYLTGGNLDKALDMCEDNLPTEGVSNCQNGVYMELFNYEVLANEPKFVDPNSPMETCELRQIGKSDCYVYSATYLTETLELGIEELRNACSNVESGYQKYCISGLAKQLAKKNLNSSEKVVEFCENLSVSDQRKECVIGAVSLHISQFGSLDAGNNFCKFINSDLSQTCFKEVSDKEQLFELIN